MYGVISLRDPILINLSLVIKILELEVEQEAFVPLGCVLPLYRLQVFLSPE